MDNGKWIMAGLLLTFSIFNSQLSIAWAECLLLPLTGNGSDASPFQPSFPPGMNKIPGFKWNAHIPSKTDGTPQYPDAYVCFPEGFKFPPGLTALPPAEVAGGILKRDPKANVGHMAKLPPAVIKASWRDYYERASRLARKYLGVAFAWAALATDNFNSGTSALSANWSSGYTGESIPTVVSDAAECAFGLRCIASFNALVPGPDQYAQGVVAQYDIGNDGDAGVGVRMAAPSTFTGYFARTGLFTSIGGSTRLQKRVGGANTSLSSDATFPVWAAGTDIVRLEAIGTALTVYQNGDILLTGTDSEISSGRGGIFLNSANALEGETASFARLDNFELGDLGEGVPTVARRRVVVQ